MEDQIIKNEEIDYNEEPVHYCSHCLYLGNPSIAPFNYNNKPLEFCPYCGSTDFNDSHIFDWEKKFEEKYGIKYLKIKNKTWRKIMEM
jgi:hypothetical protein